MNGCELWQGTKNAKGYGMCSWTTFPKTARAAIAARKEVKNG